MKKDKSGADPRFLIGGCAHPGFFLGGGAQIVFLHTSCINNSYKMGNSVR